MYLPRELSPYALLQEKPEAAMLVSSDSSLFPTEPRVRSWMGKGLWCGLGYRRRKRRRGRGGSSYDVRQPPGTKHLGHPSHCSCPSSSVNSSPDTLLFLLLDFLFTCDNYTSHDIFTVFGGCWGRNLGLCAARRTIS